MSSNGIIRQLKQLLYRHGFILDEITRNGEKIQQSVKYGTPGTLLRKNIQCEWWNSVVVQERDVFPVENSVIFGDNNINSGQECFKLQSSSEENLSMCMRRKVDTDMLDHYIPTLTLLNHRLPFSLVQIGKYYKTVTENVEETLIQRGTENTSMVLQYFTAPSMMFQSFDQWVVNRVRWWKMLFRIPENLSTTDLKSDSNEIMSTNIQYKCPWGIETIETVSNRGDTPLQNLENRTQINCKVKWMRKTIVPHILQIETSLENSMMAILVDAIKEKTSFNTTKHVKHEDPRCVLQLHTHLAPFKVAMVTSGSKGKEIRHVADHFLKELRLSGIMVFDILDAGTQDSQFKRYDELGIPYTIIINDQTLDTGIIGLRNRDTTLREQLHVTNMCEKLMRYLKPL